MSSRNLNLDKLARTLDDWIAMAATNGRIRVADNDRIAVILTADNPPGRLQISMSVGDRPLFLRTPSDLKKQVMEASPEVASDGCTFVSIIYEEPVEREIGPFARNARIKSALWNLLEPYLAFAHVASRLRGFPALPESAKYIQTAVSLIEAAEARLENGGDFDTMAPGRTVDAVLDSEIASSASTMRSQREMGGKSLSRNVREIFDAKNPEANSGGGRKAEFLLLSLDGIVDELGRLLIDGYRSLPLPKQESEASFSTRETCMLSLNSWRRDAVVRVRVWSLAGMAFATEILETEDVPMHAAKAIAEEAPTTWKSRWEDEIEDSLLASSRIEERCAKLDAETGKKLRQKHGLIDGRSVEDAIMDAIYTRYRWEEAAMIVAAETAGARLLKMPSKIIH